VNVVALFRLSIVDGLPPLSLCLLVQVSACGFHSCVLLDGGEVYSWGDGKFGRLGHGSESTLGVPRIIDRLRGVRITQVSCGGFHTAAVCEEGQYVQCCRLAWC
jgi:alpha-tubulin suppressor-like RCC1 family protein